MKLPLETKITGEMVTQAMTRAAITRVEHHRCHFCHYRCAYVRVEGNPMFDAGCKCTTGGYIRRPVTWDEIADWINAQSEQRWKVELAARCGITLEDDREDDAGQTYQETQEPENERAAEELAEIETAWGVPVPRS